MHTLHTTDAFVLGSTPHGESNRVYSLFTRTFGFVYAHGQGVRRLENRNRYALTTGSISKVTLVRGREVWRITGAQREYGTRIASPAERRAFALISAFAPREEALPDLFTSLRTAHEASATYRDTHEQAIETLTALRVLHALGYVASPTDVAWPEGFLGTTACTEDILIQVALHKPAIVMLINNALSSANT